MKPIEVKFHVEALWDGGRKVCSNGPCHMTKMSIYGKKPLKIFFSKTNGPMTLGLGMQQRGLGPNKVYHPLRQCQICFLMLLYGKIYISSGTMLESHLMEETYNK